MKKLLPFLSVIMFLAWNCSNDDAIEEPAENDSTAKLRLQFGFDPDQERLDNFGNPSTIPQGNATQTPDFNSMSAFFIELVPTQFTQLRDGAVIYEAPQQTAQNSSPFDEAVVFSDAIVSDENEIFLEIPIKDIPIGNYEYLRASVTYQNANIRFNLKNLPSPLPTNLDNQKGTLASFIGFNTYIQDLTVSSQTLTIEADRQQGFWAFEPQLDAPYQDLYTQYVNSSGILSGQAPIGGTTVVNPLAQFGVELPAGSCIVTGAFDQSLNITGEETEDVTLTLSFSINNSFEWIDNNNNGEWDFNLNDNTVEPLVDMGLRGLKVEVD